MKKLIFSPKALEDIVSIWDYTVDKWGLDQARNYIRKIEAACQSIAAGEKRIKPFDDLPEISGYMRCDHHFIFVIDNDESTNILAVLHERMELLTRLMKRLEEE